ncbi:MAG: ion transporter [Methylococcales bacterium]
MTETSAIQARSYELFMLALCLYALLVLGADSFFQLDDSSRQILQWADDGICGIFFVDFLLSLARAKDRWRYFLTWGWIDLVSSIPMVDALRFGRLARIFRIFRVLRGVRATKLIAGFILEWRAEGAFLAAMLVSLLLVVFSSIAVLQFENATDSNIKGPGDALWWAFVTLTTVGYGDRFPVTPEGRLVGVLLMTAGVGLFGTVSGFVATWFLSPKAKQQDTELENLRREIAALREELRRSQDRGAT